MTREELQKLVDDNPWYNGMACGIGLCRILTHDAEQRAEIARLQNEVALLKADDAEGCELIRDMEDEERRKDAVIEEQAQEIARLREALASVLECAIKDIARIIL